MAAFATIRLFQAVCLGSCIEVGDMTLGDAVVAEEQLVEGLRQVGPHGFSQGIQIGLVIVIGSLHCQRHMGVSAWAMSSLTRSTAVSETAHERQCRNKGIKSNWETPCWESFSKAEPMEGF